MRGLGGEGGYSNYILGKYRKTTEMVRKTPEPTGGGMTSRMARVMSGTERGVRTNRFMCVAIKMAGPANGYGPQGAPIAQGSPPFPEAC